MTYLTGMLGIAFMLAGITSFALVLAPRAEISAYLFCAGASLFLGIAWGKSCRERS